jgi:hypothetical protein
MDKVWCDICEQPLDPHDPETVECVGPDHKGGIFMHKQCGLRKLRVRIEWLRSDYRALEKLTNASNAMTPLEQPDSPEDVLARIEETYKWEVQLFYPNEVPKWLKEDWDRLGFTPFFY